MATGLNLCIFMGRLANEPEMKVVGNDKVKCEFGLAIETKWKDADGHKQSDVEWINCIAWNQMAKTVGKYLQKGNSVLVEGRWETQKWEKDGQKRSRTMCVVNKCLFLDGNNRKKKDGEAPAEGGAEPDLETPPF